MLSAASMIKKIQSLTSDENETNNSDLYHEVFNYYTSADVIDDYEHAVKQLDNISLSDTNQWLLFHMFHMCTDRTLYTDEQRDKLCQFWLSIYESMVKQLLPEEKMVTQENIDHERLVVIKYLIANMIEMQKTSESLSHFLKEETQFQNFAQKNEYLAIIKLVLPLLLNHHIVKRSNEDERNGIKLEWESNELANITNVTTTLVLWIILKLTIMFIKADGDCLTIAKHDKNIKNILLTSMKQFQDDNPIKLFLYVTAALLLNDEDIKNQIDDPMKIITTLTTNIQQVIDSEDDEDSGFSTNGVHIVDLMVALKAYLQHDQVKNGFIDNNGLKLLMDIVDEDSEEDSEDYNLEIDEDDKQEMESDPEYRKTLEKMQSNFKNDIIEMTKGMELLAFECLHVMSFNEKAAHIMRKNEKLMSQLRTFTNESNTTIEPISEPLKKAIDGLLWKLEKEDQFKKEQHTTKEKGEFDMMISYSWSDKPLVHEIYKHLTEDYKFKIWLDENQMAGSLCQAMAQAVEKSKFILMCMSETYKGSENCRNEAEYARDRKKLIIPLVMKKVERDGWLGFISAGKMYIDFAKLDFQKAIQLLIAEIQRNQQVKGNTVVTVAPKEKRSSIITSAPPPPPPTVSVPLTSKLPARPKEISNAYKEVPMGRWSAQHVEDFLYDNKLDLMVLLTEHMNGEELNILLNKCLIQQDCWSMFERLNKEIEKRYQQILPLSVYLRFINQTQKYSDVSSF